MPDPAAFVADCYRLVAPGGMLILSTLNRTPRAFLLGIIGAEYVLRWLPRGTHDWKRFLRPSELAGLLRAQGGAIGDGHGDCLFTADRAFQFKATRSGRELSYLCHALKSPAGLAAKKKSSGRQSPLAATALFRTEENSRPQQMSQRPPDLVIPAARRAHINMHEIAFGIISHTTSMQTQRHSVQHMQRHAGNMNIHRLPLHMIGM